MPARLREFYNKTVCPDLTKKFGYDNPMKLPRLSKIVLNMGVGEAVQDKKVLTEDIINKVVSEVEKKASELEN